MHRGASEYVGASKVQYLVEESKRSIFLFFDGMQNGYLLLQLYEPVELILPRRK